MREESGTELHEDAPVRAGFTDHHSVASFLLARGVSNLQSSSARR